MLNPEDLYLANTKILDDPRMHGLTLVIALSSPQDAGSTAGQLGQVLLSELKNIEIVEFDSDQLHNYRARRPFIRYEKTTSKAAIPAAEALRRRRQPRQAIPATHRCRTGPAVAALRKRQC